MCSICFSYSWLVFVMLSLLAAMFHNGRYPMVQRLSGMYD